MTPDSMSAIFSRASLGAVGVPAPPAVPAPRAVVAEAATVRIMRPMGCTCLRNVIPP